MNEFFDKLLKLIDENKEALKVNFTEFIEKDEVNPESGLHIILNDSKEIFLEFKCD